MSQRKSKSERRGISVLKQTVTGILPGWKIAEFAANEKIKVREFSTPVRSERSAMQDTSPRSNQSRKSAECIWEKSPNGIEKTLNELTVQSGFRRTLKRKCASFAQKWKIDPFSRKQKKPRFREVSHNRMVEFEGLPPFRPCRRSFLGFSGHSKQCNFR